MSDSPAEMADLDTILARIREEARKRAPRDETGGLVPGRLRPLRISIAPVSVPQTEPAGDGGPDGPLHFSDFDAMDEADFVETAYRAMLGRPADAAGREHYLDHLRAGRVTRAQMLKSLGESEEGRAHDARIVGLDRQLAREAAPAMRFGRLRARLYAVLDLPGHLRRIARRQTASDTRQRVALDGLNDTLSQLRRDLALLDARLAEAAGAVSEIRGLATDQMQATRAQIADQSLKLSALVEKAAKGGRKGSAEAIEAIAAHALDDLYLAFEDQFRGSRAEISRRVARYLPMVADNPAVRAGRTVLDIGCGRGEWLRLLADRNIAARGVDSNIAMASACREQGLDVSQGDAIAHLRGLAPGSLAGVTGFHIVEHLPFDVLVGLFDAALAALAPGGFILFETPNPENLVVGAFTFNHDPTHKKPLPPEVLRFIATARGFAATRIIRQPSDCDLSQPEFRFAPAGVEDWFSLPPDYALYAQKAAESAEA